MITRRAAVGVLAIGASALVTGCGLLDRSSSYRFRMTVEAETPQGPRSGSGVLQVNAMKSVALTAHEHAGGVGLQGEAVVLDLPEGPVFVLLQPVKPSSTLLPVRITKALDPNAVPSDAGAFLSSVQRLGREPGQAKAVLQQADWPLMARFRDISDPRTVEKVDAEALGVKWIRLETTDDRLTTGIEKIIGWLPKVYQMGIGPEFHPDGIPVGDFKRLFSTEIE